MRWLPMLLLMTLPAAAWAQHAGDRQLTGQVGWQWGGTQTYSTYSAYPAGDVHAEAAVNYGGTFTAFVREGEALEIAYSYQPTDLILRPNGIPSFKIADLACHTLHLNGLRALPAGGGKVEPYVLGGLGTTVFSAQGYTSRWLFSIAANLCRGLGAQEARRGELLAAAQLSLDLPPAEDEPREREVRIALVQRLLSRVEVAPPSMVCSTAPVAHGG